MWRNRGIIDKRIKALVSITGVNFGRLFREGFSGFNPIGTPMRLFSRLSAACGLRSTMTTSPHVSLDKAQGSATVHEAGGHIEFA